MIIEQGEQNVIHVTPVATWAGVVTPEEAQRQIVSYTHRALLAFFAGAAHPDVTPADRDTLMMDFTAIFFDTLEDALIAHLGNEQGAQDYIALVAKLRSEMAGGAA